MIDGAENDQLAAWADRTPAVILNVQRQPGSNVIAVVKNITDLLPRLRATMPAAVDVAVLSDRTGTIRASVSDVEFELGLAVALVVLVIFLFLRNLAKLLTDNVNAYADTLRITQNQYRAGTIAGSDVAAATTQLETARAQSVNVGVLRAEYEHAIAVLIGAQVSPRLAMPTARATPSTCSLQRCASTSNPTPCRINSLVRSAARAAAPMAKTTSSRKLESVVFPG